MGTEGHDNNMDPNLASTSSAAQQEATQITMTANQAPRAGDHRSPDATISTDATESVVDEASEGQMESPAFYKDALAEQSGLASSSKSSDGSGPPKSRDT